MAAEILRPQDCFVERIRVSPCRRRNYSYNHGHNYGYNGYSNQIARYNEYANPRPSRKLTVRPERTDQRRRSPEHPAPASKRSSSVDDLKVARNHNNHRLGNKGAGAGAGENLVMEKVSILRRGESLDSKMKSLTAAKNDQIGDMIVTGTDRLGPDPEMVPKQLRIAEFRSPAAGKTDMYAGSGFAVSPAPSSLPFPSFSKKKPLAVDDSATRDLRRLLRLDF